MEGTRNMLFGALWLIGGVAITAATYSKASGGGQYIVTYGAIVFGGIQFMVGLFQFVVDLSQDVWFKFNNWRNRR